MVHVFAALLMLISASGLRQVAAQDVDFERDIAPILEARCWDCHGEDEQESGLRLDLRTRMLKGGDSGLAAIVPGHPEKSYLIDVVKHLSGKGVRNRFLTGAVDLGRSEGMARPKRAVERGLI